MEKPKNFKEYIDNFKKQTIPFKIFVSIYLFGFFIGIIAVISGGLEMIPGVGLVLFLYLLYFVPYLVAGSLKHPNETSIFLFNLFLGWTFIGWVITLVWAVLKSKQINEKDKEAKVLEKDPILTLKQQFAEVKINEKEYKTRKKILEES